MRPQQKPSRKRLCRLAAFALPAALLVPSVGCIREHLNAAPTNDVFINGQLQKEKAALAEAELTSEGKRKPPKASTYVAYGDWLRACGDTAVGFSRKCDKESRRQELRNEASQRYVAAKERYLQALQAEPNEVGAHLGLARVAVAEGNYAAAQERYAKAVAIVPNNAGLLYEIGMMHARNKQWEPALANLKRATELEPVNSSFATNYGWTLARAERFEEAWHIFRQQVGEAQAYYRLALMSRQVGRDDLTKAYLTYALQREPGLQEAQQMLAGLNQPNAAPAGTPNASMPDAGQVVPASHTQRGSGQ